MVQRGLKGSSGCNADVVQIDEMNLHGYAWTSWITGKSLFLRRNVHCFPTLEIACMEGAKHDRNKTQLFSYYRLSSALALGILCSRC
jgi:hypothetical protein